MSAAHKTARTTGRTTSAEAGHIAQRRTGGELHQIILKRLEDFGPSIDERIARGLTGPGGYSVSGIRSRRNELVLAGHVTELRDEHGAVVKKPGQSGSLCTVWRLVRPDECHTPPSPTRENKGPRLGDTDSPEHAAGVEAARRALEWHCGGVGAHYWADIAVEAYLHPAAAQAELDTMGARP